jgi:hypothetical protein
MTEPVDPRISEARRMREEGVSNAEIAARFGVSKSTVCRWTVPGALERERASSLAAKQRRRRPCPRCGGRVDITRAGELCRTCVDDDNREARMDRAVRCLQEWHALHGRVPTAPEWGAGGPGYRRVKTLASDGQPWPWYQHVSEDFGSWEAAAAPWCTRRPRGVARIAGVLVGARHHPVDPVVGGHVRRTTSEPGVEARWRRSSIGEHGL